jgi:hypothetical protein
LRQRADRIGKVVFETGRGLGRHPGSRHHKAQNGDEHEQVGGEIVDKELPRSRFPILSTPSADQQKEQQRARFKREGKKERIVREKQPEERSLE